MSEGKITRLASAAKELNVGISTIVDHLHSKGFKDVASTPNTKLTEEQYDILLRDFRSDIVAKEKAEQINIGKRKEEEITIKEALKEAPKVVVVEKVEVKEVKKEEEITAVKHEVEGPKILGKIDLDKPKKKKEVEEKKVEVVAEVEQPKETTKKEEVEITEKPVPEQKEEVEVKVEEKIVEKVVEVKKSEDFVRAKIETLSGPKILGKIELPIKAERRPEEIYRDEEKAKRDKEREKLKEGRDASQKRARIVQNKVDIKKFEPSKDTRPARLAAVPARSACSKAFFRSSRPVTSATAPVASSPSPARPVMAPAASSSTRRWRSRFRRGSMKVIASGCPVKASMASMVARRAISTCRSTSSSMPYLRVTTTTCIAKCRSPSLPQHSVAKLKSRHWMAPQPSRFLPRPSRGVFSVCAARVSRGYAATLMVT